MKSTLTTIVAIFVIALVIWTAFSLTPYPLDQLSTVVVVGVVGLAVFGGRAIFANVAKGRGKPEPSARPKPSTSPTSGEPRD